MLENITRRPQRRKVSVLLKFRDPVMAAALTISAALHLSLSLLSGHENSGRNGRIRIGPNQKNKIISLLSCHEPKGNVAIRPFLSG